jgi:hypothetical protein
MQFGRGKPAVGAFYDSDFTTMDSVLALGVLHGLQSKSDCRVAIVTMTRPNLAVAGFADMLERYYRGPAAVFAQVPPVGMRTAGQPGDISPAFTKPFEMKKADGSPLYTNAVKRVLDTGDPNTMIRNYLEAHADQNAFFISVGPATNLASALEFRGMKDLIVAKLKYLVITDRFASDIAAAKKVVADWPTPIYLAGSDVGAALPFPGASIDKEFVAANPESPFISAYKAYKPMPYDTPGTAMAAALYAVRPQEGYFKVSEPGTITVRDDGKTSFAASAQGKHHVLSADAEKKSQVIQAFVDLASAKPVIQQRFRPPAADDKKADPKADSKADDKKVETPEKKP